MQLRKADNEAPPQQWQLNELQPGRDVRLNTSTGEVLWARVTSLQQTDGSYEAEIEHAEGIRPGAKIQFRKYHVTAIA